MKKSVNTRSLYAILAPALKGERRSISIGMSRNEAGYSSRTPVLVVGGKLPPELHGNPCLKQPYKPSTLHVVVGREWLKAQGYVESATGQR
jgi:hypothetical protein